MLAHGPATSYDLKQRVGGTIGNFWAFAHSQLYDEPARLAEAGLLVASEEEGGRRRRTYSITDLGRAALREWLSAPTPDQTEVRDLGLLKLFFSTFGADGDLATLAHDRFESHRARADEYARMYEVLVPHADPWSMKSLELGIRIERCAQEFWAEFRDELGGA
ncbi:PadR family transcriptional regulator [Actinokineospora auranticolor]|uniref:DNA-binding PadR family transcriptional regulator n=1 Tax=Actinokineospora auranticolor TaxID=155976 RepID=A0A2S6GZ00_9PSEU|nr:PadR family transcriptional regulator [Actinokineospora auranticolor]PPK70453.1 DNA-binding PadR family transcriptional regulator [Actinokineospora auranticolor]